MGKIGTGRFGIDGYSASSYGDAFADVYDTWYADLKDDDFAMYLATLLPDHTATILELGIGTGRLMEKLASLRGQLQNPHTDLAFGIDSSQAMLDKLKERSALDHVDTQSHNNPLSNVTTMCGDFSQQLPDATCDLIFVGYNTLFNLPDDEALASCLRLVRSRLAANGYFALDVVVPEAQSTPQTVTVKSLTSDSVTLAVSRHDHHEQRIIGQFVEIGTSGTPVLRPWSVRYWTPSQLDQHAAAAGLKLVTRIADGYGTQHQPDDARHISVYAIA